MYVCFILPHPATFFPHANRPHGLKAEAISVEKWGIATDRLKKIPNPRTGSRLLPTGSCILGLLGVLSCMYNGKFDLKESCNAIRALGSWLLASWLLVLCILNSSLTNAALKLNHCLALCSCPLVPAYWAP